jgi:transcriptional regulator NrdR family protein
MKCPGCGSLETAVVDSRERLGQQMRRRRCDDCKQRFSTEERVIGHSRAFTRKLADTRRSVAALSRSLTELGQL